MCNAHRYCSVPVIGQLLEGSKDGVRQLLPQKAALGACLKTTVPNPSSISFVLCNIFLVEISEVEEVFYELNTT